MPARYGAKAVFRVIGPQAKAHPDPVKKVAAAGHRLCDHSTDHDTSMDKKPVASSRRRPSTRRSRSGKPPAAPRSSTTGRRAAPSPPTAGGSPPSTRSWPG
ncbi:polysaccharide deacetylase family protein [Streptomyces sp. NPDC012794]|uniref:polysaccharide deacetylase family protein n=1 Tax=Streptomyces sp. NPDC012794 TaxID=3364850 RepID=UPI0036BD800E